MILIKQIALWNNEGNADKIYEIDLCETMPGRYVVNFRYGRRGSTLKDGTKTAMPVALQKAEELFNKLAEEKRKGGYRDTDNYEAAHESTATTQPSAVENAGTGKQAYVLKCLQEAAQPIPGKITGKWPLGRIIWRAGELRIAAAAPLIIPQLTRGDAVHQYTACWSLGRCGNSIAIVPLEQVYTSKATAPHVKRIALAALLELQKANNTDKELIQTLLNSLPKDLQSFIQQGDAKNIQLQLGLLSSSHATLEHVTTVYLLGEHYNAINDAVSEWLKSVSFAPNYFKVVRHIFKLAEFREDAQVFSLLAHKFHQTDGLFKYNPYNRNSDVYHDGKNYKRPIDELKKLNSSLAYSDTTHEYLARRVWRTMRKLGKDGNETYIRYAFGVLLNYNDSLDDEPATEQIETIVYRYNQGTRTYENHVISKTYSAFPNSHLLNHILYSGGDRYFLKRNTNAWQLKPESSNDELIKREEAFPELWDKYPQALVQLLIDSQVEVVHNFAVKVLNGRSDIAGFFDIEALKKLLQKPFASTATLALKLAQNMYNANEPDEQLVIALLSHALPAARTLAIKWITEQVDYFFEKTDVPIHAIINPHNDVFEAAGKWLNTRKTFVSINLILNKVIEQLLAMPANMSLATEAATHAGKLLAEHFMLVLSQLNLDIPARLLQHQLAALQLLGSIILLNHQKQPRQFPPGLLSLMIQSNNPAVRQAGITLFGRLPQEQLFDNAALIAAFCVSPYTEIRTTIQPTISTLNQANKEFGKTLLYDLLPYMQRKETTEGLHENLYELFTNVLAEHLNYIDEPTALAFVHSRFLAAQLLGLYILKNFDKANGFSMRQWIRMANHEVVDIRQFTWELFNNNVTRVQSEASESLRLLDSTWDDSRAFAFGYFRKHFSEDNWTPELLVSVCDSTRDDVQSFGRELLTKYFKEENGELYLMQLSQHPGQQVQHFTTHYLEQFAANKPVNVEKLEAYFITVLSSVNRAGIAKKRIFNFLQEEALKSEQVAITASGIMARQSSTMAVADKAACIVIMYNLRKKYPNLQMPLFILPVETYQKSSHSLS